MKLGAKQEVFSRLMCQLVTHMHEQGYEVRMGEVWRSKAAAEDNARRGVGIVNSCHRLKIALDINLFLDGDYLTTTEDHRVFGEFWEGLGAAHGVNTCWGGRFKRRDGNHYSIEHNGVK